MDEIKEKKTYHKKKLLIAGGIFLLLIVGVTIAYFSTSDTFNNLFDAAEYGADATEVFTSPTDWMPGDTTPKTLTVTNSGDVCENVRVSYTEEWESKDGSTLSNVQDGNKAALINRMNEDDWVQSGNYYYYINNLMPNQTTSSFMNSVTFNPEIENDYVCTQTGNKRRCTSSEAGYDEATYTLTLKVETIQCDATEDEWGVNVGSLKGAVFDTGATVNAKLKTMAAGTTKQWSSADRLITGFVRSNELPNDFVATTANTISAASSDPIYAWFDNGTIYYYSERENIYFNSNSAYFFNHFLKLSNISSLSSIKTSKITNMEDMFMDCYAITSLEPLTNWDTSKVTNMNGVFCMTINYVDISVTSPITSLSPLASWDTSNVTDMSFMFASLKNVTSLQPLANWKTSKVTNMSSLFSGVNIATLQPLANWKTSKVTNMNSIFLGCTSLTDIQALSTWNVSKVENFSKAFSTCSALTNLQPLATWNMSHAYELGEMFSKCRNLVTLQGLNNWDVSNVIGMMGIFAECTSLSNIQALSTWNIQHVEKLQEAFKNCSSLTSLASLSSWNTSSVLTINNMFGDCIYITDLTPLSNWNTSNIEDMSQAFKGCVRLTSLNGLSGWNTSNVEVMTEMFMSCDISNASAINNWDLSSVVFTANTELGNGFWRMFYDCGTVPTFTNRTGTWSGGSFIPSS